MQPPDQRPTASRPEEQQRLQSIQPENRLRSLVEGILIVAISAIALVILAWLLSMCAG